MSPPRNATLRLLLPLAALLLGAASAHADLDASDPPAFALLTAAPEALELRYSMDIETRFSSFKVYRLEAEVPEAPSDRDRQRLNALAAARVTEVLGTRGDESERADAGLSDTARTTRVVRLALKDDLMPGVYVAMWRVLAIDTHWTQDFFIFLYAPLE